MTDCEDDAEGSTFEDLVIQFMYLGGKLSANCLILYDTTINGGMIEICDYSYVLICI